jgi:hypothetical protein
VDALAICGSECEFFREQTDFLGIFWPVGGGRESEGVLFFLLLLLVLLLCCPPLPPPFFLYHGCCIANSKAGGCVKRIVLFLLSPCVPECLSEGASE